jgi:hypothetical protein
MERPMKKRRSAAGRASLQVLPQYRALPSGPAPRVLLVKQVKERPLSENPGAALRHVERERRKK